jgi:integrase
VRWRAETDKQEWEHHGPLSSIAIEALRTARRKRPVLGDAWIFPSPKDAGLPCSRHVMRDWWGRAEKLAGLAPVKRRGWHSLRRKFATELAATLPLKDLCAAGGWRDAQTILKCYQQPDEDRIRAALENRNDPGPGPPTTGQSTGIAGVGPNAKPRRP